MQVQIFLEIDKIMFELQLIFQMNDNGGEIALVDLG